MGALIQVMLIRHAEKPDAKGGKPHGVNAEGGRDESSLTIRGWQRAGALVNLFSAPDPGRVPFKLLKPSVLYASASHGGSHRPLETITPLAGKLGLEPITSFTKGEEAALAAAVLRQTGVVLIAWQHERILEIAAHLTVAAPPHAAIPRDWPPERFDVVWVFTLPSGAVGSWTFRQAPQMLLAGDQLASIGGAGA
jgi:broad specificity phosphatase PhoE